MTDTPYLTVHALTKYIKRKFEADPYLRNVYVKGELSNVKKHPSGHVYFTLKDEQSRIQAAMFRMHASKLKFQPENGMKVVITGDVNVYEAAGAYQLYVQSMQPDGVGALYLAFEQMKERLAKEGLFDERFKQPLPFIPETVGVITAQSGAAIQDICSTIERRFPLAEIVLFPAIVQGDQAAPSIVRAIQQAEQYEGIDVLIVGRGGGSIEDLWAFNEESVARAIFSCRIPIISAVGHETDTTIADYVADRRAPTPTAAAELAVPSRSELTERILDRKRLIYRSAAFRLQQEKKRLQRAQSTYPLQFPDRLYRPFTEKLLELEGRFSRASRDITQYRKSQWMTLHTLLTSQSPQQRIRENGEQTTRLTDRMTRAVLQETAKKQQHFQSIVRMLQALNPLEVMSRGFSIVYQNDQMITSVEQVKHEQSIQIRLQDGQINAEIVAIELKGED